MHEFLPDIDAYIKGELLGEELKQFEERMADDPEFRQEVSFYQKAQFALDDQDKILSFQTLIGELGENASNQNELHSTDSSGGKTISFWKPWMSVAAAVLVLIVLIPLLMNLFEPQHKDSLALYAEYYQPLPETFWDNQKNPNVSINSQDQTNQLRWAAALGAYQKGEYDAAISGFDSLMKEGYQGQASELMISLSYLADDSISQEEWTRSENALRYFRDKQDYFEPATWYLALAYVKRGETEEAAKLLKELMDSESYGEKAQKLLSEL